MLESIKKNRLIIIHIFFWCMYFSFFFYQISMGKGNRDTTNYTLSLMDAVIQILLLVTISYLNYFLFLPKFLKHKNSWKYILEIIPTLIIIVFLQVIYKRWLYREAFPNSNEFFTRPSFIIQHTLNSIFVVAFIAMLRFAKDWFELEVRREQIENEKLTAELRFLKDQINPHFLFNTLNNLYYLAHSQSTKTKDVIAKLSQIMRYMIYDSNQDRVPVSKEIEYIENYISLEKMRLEDDFEINFTKIGDYHNLQIAPFIFITFLENAFKHGTGGGLENGKINVSLSFDKNQCTYSVENRIALNNTSSEKSGIGLSNIKRRLNLEYQGKHSLQIIESDENYLAKLTIKL